MNLSGELGTRQAARRLGVSIATVIRAIHKGTLLARMVNGYRWAIQESSLERFFVAGPVAEISITPPIEKTTPIEVISP